MSELPFLKSPLRSHEDVIARAREIEHAGGLARVVVAAAEEDDVLAAMYECKKDGISDAILVGYPDRVYEALDTAEVPRDTFELIGVADEQEAAIKTAELAGAGEADVVMKGFLKTSILLKTLLKHDYGLRDRELVSHSAVLSIPKYGKLLNITDGGTLIAPTHEQKLTITANAVNVMRAMGIVKPHVAVIAPNETVRDSVPETVQARDLVADLSKHWAQFLEADGPLPFDLVVTDPSLLGMKLTSSVAGQADILIGHTIEEVNITAKTLIQFGGAVFMGVIAGAKVPISLVSRSDSMLNKMASIALAVCLSDYKQRGFQPLPPLSETSSGEDV